MVNLDKFMKQEEERQEQIRRLEKYKRVRLVTKDEVIDKFGGDFVPTRYGFMSTNISEEDYKKVLDIESRIHDNMISEIGLHTLKDLGKHEIASEDVNERASKLRADLYYELEVHTHENGNLESGLIDKLIQPLIDKGVYVPKANTQTICALTMSQLCIDGFFDQVSTMMADVDENMQIDKFKIVVIQ